MKLAPRSIIISSSYAYLAPSHPSFKNVGIMIYKCMAQFLTLYLLINSYWCFISCAIIKTPVLWSHSKKKQKEVLFNFDSQSSLLSLSPLIILLCIEVTGAWDEDDYQSNFQKRLIPEFCKKALNSLTMLKTNVC